MLIILGETLLNATAAKTKNALYVIPCVVTTSKHCKHMAIFVQKGAD